MTKVSFTIAATIKNQETRKQQAFIHMNSPTLRDGYRNQVLNVKTLSVLLTVLKKLHTLHCKKKNLWQQSFQTVSVK